MHSVVQVCSKHNKLVYFKWLFLQSCILSPRTRKLWWNRKHWLLIWIKFLVRLNHFKFLIFKISNVSERVVFRQIKNLIACRYSMLSLQGWPEKKRPVYASQKSHLKKPNFGQPKLFVFTISLFFCQIGQIDMKNWSIW